MNYKRCQECGSRWGHELENDSILCLNCWDRVHGVEKPPTMLVDDTPRIYDMTTGRALPGHPGLA